MPTQLATSTISTLLSSITGTFYDYFIVLIQQALPFALGIGVIAVIIGLGYGLFHLLHR